MTLLPILVIAIVAIVVFLMLPAKPGSATGPVNFPAFAMRSPRDLELDEDLASVSEAYRESERIARQKAAIAKIAALHEPATKSK